MTSSFEENQTSLIEEFSSIYLNDSCEPDCHTLSKPNPFDEDLPTQILISFALIFVLASISIAVIFHRLEKKCSNEQKRRNELNQNEMINAHPFEEIRVINDGNQSTDQSS